MLRPPRRPPLQTRSRKFRNGPVRRCRNEACRTVDFVGAHADGACRIVVRLVACRGSREIGAGHSDYEIGRLVVMDSPDVEITRRRLVAASDPVELHLVPARVVGRERRQRRAGCVLHVARNRLAGNGPLAVGGQNGAGTSTASVICCPTITVAVTAVPVAGLTALIAMVVGVVISMYGSTMFAVAWLPPPEASWQRYGLLSCTVTAVVKPSSIPPAVAMVTSCPRPSPRLWDF